MKTSMKLNQSEYQSRHGGNRFAFAAKYGFEIGGIYDFSTNVFPFPLPQALQDELHFHESEVRRYPDCEARELIETIQQTYEQPVLVEAYIDDESMREFSVGIIGNGPYLYTPVEIDFDAMPVEEKILSFDAAQKDLEVIKVVEEQELQDELKALALQTFEAVGAKDYSRIDLRMDQDTCYVLEINTMPGLGPHSFLPEAMRDQHGLDYPQFIQKLVEVAIQG
jgi:D-alanine-D-alanine ligase